MPISEKARVEIALDGRDADVALKELTDNVDKYTAALTRAYEAGDKNALKKAATDLKKAERDLATFKKQTFEVSKVLNNLNGSSLNDLRRAEKQITAEMSKMTRGTKEYITANSNLVKVRGEIRNIRSQMNGYTGSVNKASNATKLFNQIIKFSPIGIILAAIAGIKRLGSGLFNLSKTIQGEAIRSQTVFGNELGYVEQQADKLAKKMGVTNREFVTMAAATADLLIPLDFTRKQSAEMSVQLQSLTGALDEWTAGSVGAKEISQILTKAMLGENEQLKQLGIAIRKDTDEFRDLVKEKIKTTGATKAQAEAMATLELIQKKSADAQSAYNKEGNQLLRFQKEAGRRWKQLKEDVVGWFEVDTETKLRNEQDLVNKLVTELTDANTSEDRRREILAELNRISPTILQNIDTENISVKQLADNMRAYNDEIAKRIVLANLEEEEQKQAAKQAKQLEKLTNLQADAFELMRKGIEINKNFNVELGKQMEEIYYGTATTTEKIEQFQALLNNDKNKNSQFSKLVDDISKAQKKLDRTSENALDFTTRIEEMKKILGLINEEIDTDPPTVLSKLTDDQKKDLLKDAKEFLKKLRDEIKSDDSVDKLYAEDLYGFEDRIQAETDAEAMAVQESIDLQAQKYAEFGKQRWQDYDDQVEYLKGIQAQTQEYVGFVSGMLNQALEDGKITQQEMLKILTLTLLKAIKNTLTASITKVTIESLSTADSVASFGITGAIRAGIMIGLIEAAYSGIESALNSNISQAKHGRYPVTGTEDGRMYYANYYGTPTSGILNQGRPTIINEQGGEYIMTSAHTRNIATINPGLFDIINSYRVPQRAEGNYPVVQQPQQQSNSELMVLIRETNVVNKQMLSALRNLKAKVVYTDFEEVQDDITEVRNYAAGN